ncbi:Protein DBF4 like protein A [Astathelohania contejeani]|uniref:Protein DBF4 like protein A n=1 Tax=Astathelohania contejeani TaxID=164912 RepID=A0ABQ7HZJ8_9MICR|nr:Protein DBF4 like protein A [Thelohania contejeani]
MKMGGMKNYRIFKNPYILIEDISGKHQPFYKEYEVSKQPRLSLETRPLGCPFIENPRPRQPGKAKKATKPGFCEVCYKRYSDYYEHVLMREHREYAKEYSNYQEVDEFIINFKNEEESESCDSPLWGNNTSINNQENGREINTIERQTFEEKYIDTIVSDVDSYMKEFLNK